MINQLPTSLQTSNSQAFLDNQIIVVTIAFRLNIYGYAYVPQSSSANLALWDQVQFYYYNKSKYAQAMAFSWISEEIEAFGGDRTKVTLAGDGSGAVDVNIHLYSPLTRRLFDNFLCSIKYQHSSIVPSSNLEQLPHHGRSLEIDTT